MSTVQHTYNKRRTGELLLIAISLTFLGFSAPAQAQVNCLPSCDANDGRFLAIAGSGLNTLSDAAFDISLAVPADATSFSIGFFDGDSGKVDAVTGARYWDTGVLATFRYDIYADPEADGTGSVLVYSELSDVMPDNGWHDLVLPTDPAALTPSGNFFYRLEITLLDPALVTSNAFKVRTSGVATIEVFEQPFGFIAALASLQDAQTIFPSFPSMVPTTYDGSFSFFLDVPVSQSELLMWDGDLDYGSYDGVTADTNDPNTPDAPYLPPFAVPGTASEGVAVGSAGSTGQPADDRNPAGLGGYLLRSPSIAYNVFAPDGAIYSNSNPSGNIEWEKFLISTAPFDPTVSDAQAAQLPAGIYEVRAEGVDMANLNAWFFSRPVVCVGSDGTPCDPLRPYLIGDRVWLDANGDGIQDVGELGIAGVELEMLDADGLLVRTTTTDVSGEYSFGVLGNLVYTVRVAASNFGPGGALEDLEATTLDELSTSVTDSNDMGLDFGYTGNGSIGDLVWYDANGDGIFNEDAGSGIGGVQVTLTSAGEDGLLGTADDVFVTSTTTADDGSYLFDGLSPANYRVELDVATLPTGQVLTTSGSVDVLLASGDEITDADFGARVATGQGGSIGDLVWLDFDADGLLDGGESGLNGVAVVLALDVDGDGEAELTAATITSTLNGQAGSYLFGDLPAGVATVTVDGATLPAGAIQTYDADGTASANKATASVPDKANVLTFDFGYRGTASLNGLVWYDVDANGSIDAGEPGFENVTVDLLDDNGEVVASTTTDGTGAYSFANLLPGTYTVRIDTTTLPDNVSQTFEQDGTLTGTITVSLGIGQSAGNLTFGYTRIFPLGNSCMGSAETDAYGGSGGHSVWMPGIATDLVFEPFAGSLIEHGDGTATLSGVARSADDADKAFEVTVTLSDYRQTAPAGSPKKELSASAYVENGGPVDPSTWYYYNAFSGTFVGVGDWQGAVVEIQLVGAAFQVGVGANGKNVNDGASAWFTWQVTQQPEHGPSLKTSGQGDFNLDFVGCLGFCERSTGYWRNHTDAWPTYSLEIGGVVYGFDDLYEFVTYGGPDATMKLARQLVGAKLNLVAGADASILSVVTEADVFLAQYPPGSNPKGSAKNEGNAIKDQLDAYNTGATCEGFYELDPADNGGDGGSETPGSTPVGGDPVGGDPVGGDPVQIVLDTDDEGVELVGTWQSSTHVSGYHGAHYRHDQKKYKGHKSVRYTPDLPEAGEYQVYMWWTSNSSRADNVPVDIHHAGGTATVTVNQESNGGEWVLLGTYSFNAGTAGSVVIRTDGTNGYVVADAVKISKP